MLPRLTIHNPTISAAKPIKLLMIFSLPQLGTDAQHAFPLWRESSFNFMFIEKSTQPYMKLRRRNFNEKMLYFYSEA